VPWSYPAELPFENQAVVVAQMAILLVVVVVRRPVSRVSGHTLGSSEVDNQQAAAGSILAVMQPLRPQSS
jgi:hypothetical protein